ncbi:hypothetical protein AAHA92_23907 [Salvia divinorum]|uniref:Uncharacterized protein n=1 Tax=Salvia divinorum TaxID=28513 RepID=A0ABD1GTF2_SALDI
MDMWPWDKQDVRGCGIDLPSTNTLLRKQNGCDALEERASKFQIKINPLSQLNPPPIICRLQFLTSLLF